MAHTRCAQRRHERSRQTPTRLLQVQPFEPSPKVYLRQAAEIPADARYSTLSHCWGQYMPVKLERSTLQAFLGGIDVDSLPLTFQQAIVLTRSLGIEYIWIDSLCIIQDDDQDWANECTRMTSVYMNSFVNIGANAASDSRGGLFQRRSWKSVNPLSVRLTYIPTNWYRKPVVLWPNPEGGNLLDHAPLGDRGWVVQERLLAPRTVHFLKHKVVWECDECQASETDVAGQLESTSFSKRTYLAVPVAPSNGSAGRTTQFLDIWSDIVRFYSAGKLSVATDKLVAISGVAKYMFENRQDDRSLKYYAGLWSCNFEIQLTWSASYFSVGSRSRTYVAPSWSWASYNGEVLFP
ncbi:heterokaryon incompatibility protein-domain-containing protein, partial [Paraphoma chrysanthemicola]